MKSENHHVTSLLSQWLHGLNPHDLAHEAPVTCLPLHRPQGRCDLCEFLPIWTPACLRLPRQDCSHLGTQCVSCGLQGTDSIEGLGIRAFPPWVLIVALSWSQWDMLPLSCQSRLKLHWGCLLMLEGLLCGALWGETGKVGPREVVSTWCPCRFSCLL